MIHLCTTCAKRSDTCGGNNILWESDNDPHCPELDMDSVVECDGYVRRQDAPESVL